MDEGKRCGHETPRTKWWALPPRPGPARTLSRALKDSPNLAASNHAVELHIDPASLVDVVIHPSALPHGTTPGDIIAIRPRHIGKGKAKDCPLLYKVDKVDDDGPGKVRRSKAPVVVNQTVASTFGWAKNRTEVVLTLVSCHLVRVRGGRELILRRAGSGSSSSALYSYARRALL